MNDPGWWAAVGGNWRRLISPTKRDQLPALVGLRLLWIVAPLSWLAMLLMLLAIPDPPGGSMPWFLWVVLAAGVESAAVIAFVRSRIATGSTADEVAARVVKACIITFALADVPPLLGFVSYWIRGDGMRDFLIGSAIGLVLLLWAAPTQDAIGEIGSRARMSAAQLTKALMRPMPELTAHRPPDADRRTDR